MASSVRNSDFPGEWLLQLERDTAYVRQLVDAYGIAVAAYHLARARCRTRTISTGVPTELELFVAACELSDRLGDGDKIPSGPALANECEAAGLLVIAPTGWAA